MCRLPRPEAGSCSSGDKGLWNHPCPVVHASSKDACTGEIRESAWPTLREDRCAPRTCLSGTRYLSGHVSNGNRAYYSAYR